MNGRHATGNRTDVDANSLSKPLRRREKVKVTTGGQTNGHHGLTTRNAQKLMRPEDVTDEVLAAERDALLVEKQIQLKGVYDRHDDRVRELFQMNEYKLMLAYDPQNLKTEQSVNFTNFKAPYDLLEKVRPEAEAGPSRRTRGTRSEQLAIIPGLSFSSIKPPTKPQSRVSKGKLHSNTIHDILSSTKGKEKKSKQDKLKSSAEVGLEFPDVPPLSKTVTKKLRGPTEGDRGVLLPTGVGQPTSAVTTPATLTLQTRRTKKDHALAKPISVVENQFTNADVTMLENGHESISVVLGRRSSRLRAPAIEESPVKKVKIAVEEPPDEVGHCYIILYPFLRSIKPRNQPQELTPSEPVIRGSKSMVKPHKLKKSEHLIPPPVPEAPISTPFKIKRVKLLVRRPPPSLTHHKQRPPPPKFNSSLNNFLTSYRTLGHNEIDDDKFFKQALEDARIREREAEFRRQGRFIPGTDVLFGTEPCTTPYDPPDRTTRDAWDDIVEIVSATRGKMPKKTIGQQVAAQIASKVQAYWDTQGIKRDRARAQEEKRFRTLAKATMKMVIAEWKKAVHLVKEQKRLKVEAEERKRGHEHLDAILDQSGQLLETQQGDLRRARSRSSSMDIGMGWGNEDEDDETEEESVGDSDDEDVDGADGTSEVVQEGDTVEDGPSSTREPSETDAEPREEEEGEGEEMEGTALLLGPVRGSPAGSSGIPQQEEDGTEAEDTEMLVAGPSPRLDPSPIGGVGDVDLEPESRAPLPPQSSSPRFEAAGTLPCPEREISTEADDVLLAKDTSTVGNDKSEIDQAGVKAEEKRVGVLGSEVIGVQIGRMEEEEEEEEGDIAVRAEEEEEEEEEEAERTQAPKTIDIAYEQIEEDTQQMAEEEAEAEAEAETIPDVPLPDYLRPFAVANVEWYSEEKIKPPLLLRGILRPYQQSGLEWLASLHSNNLNGILADEMGLGKTIQTISLLAHLACDRGIWGPHLIIVPTSVLLNWEMEFKKFLPGFRVLSYHGTTKRRKELRQGWNDKYHFNVCITSYTLASRDAHIFKRKPWYYMILDEAHMIKNFKSQRWNILLMFRSFRRLLLTGTPLQNNLTELWALLQFLMSGSNFANLKEFGDWFSNPLEKAIEMGNVLDDEAMQRVTKLHTVLRPYLLRRLKRDVEKELPSKFEHLVLCPLSKRQRFLYDEFMSRAQTRDDLESGIYQKIANVLMQLRKVCNHPDLFEVRPIVTSFAMQRSATADFEIKELLVRKRWLEADDEKANLDLLGYRFVDQQDEPLLTAVETRQLSASSQLPHINDLPGEPPPKDTRTITGYRRYTAYMREVDTISRWKHIAYLNELKCSRLPIYSSEALSTVKKMYNPLFPLSALNTRHSFMNVARPIHKAVLSYAERAQSMAEEVSKFAFVTPPVVALDLPRLSLKGFEDQVASQPLGFDQILHPASVRLQIAFPDPSLLQYDCGKLQELKRLLQEKKAGGHRILIFTQMTRILDILEIFLNLNGYLYLRLDGATKIEDRQYITERFNADARIFCFIASSRSGGVGINLTGADTVVFYDSDFNPQMDKQCEDRAHRIGQIRDVHIYRFVSQHTVEEAMLRKANQKRSLDDIVIQKGEFDWRTIFNDACEEAESSSGSAAALTRALGEFEDVEDAHAAAVAAREEHVMEGADNADFGVEGGENAVRSRSRTAGGEADRAEEIVEARIGQPEGGDEGGEDDQEDEDEDEGGTVVEYMLAFVEREYNDFFKDWRV
ncbi:hypothetical protein P691DRAFT_781222 [Macrolepiota fuliginosa MF-IS2]|uniref:Helicase SWR1 n=1 Tax=Macrolepiota fuliginosa MF-IS2 TaxID=1400762 RepID=A0A9P5XC22_9AGAR|nr:hypothetical protein P691DRAFT_781222 [Macrolepiota fuliginosa MF-IS2]